MTLAGAILAFILLVWLISSLRSRLVFELSGLSLLIFGNAIPGKWVYSVIFLPGTILHELSHFLVAEILGVRTGTIEVLPEFHEKSDSLSERLGSVQTAKTGPIRSFLIGAAPFITGLAILWVLGSILSSSTLSNWYLGLLIYGIAVVGSSMLLSKEDRRAWPFVIILVILISIIFSLTPYNIPKSVSNSLLTLITALDRVLAVTVGIILGVNGVIYFFRRIIEKILGKKVVRR